MILSEQEKNRILHLHTTSRNVNGSLYSLIREDQDDVRAHKTLQSLASLADTGSSSGGSGGSGGSGNIWS